MKRVFLLSILIFCLLKLGVSQTITVSPDVICEGENSYIGTDTNLNYVNIGDILCFQGTDTMNYIIVRPEAWSQYAAAGYTALSVVFYVDETGKHGWAVGTNVTSTPLYDGEEPFVDYPDFYDDVHAAVQDLDGRGNDNYIRANEDFNPLNYPAFPSEPYYLPSIGQLNFLYSQQARTFDVLSIVGATVPDFDGGAKWWSSTGSYDEDEGYDINWCMTESGVPETDSDYYADYYYSIPVMNF